MNGSIIRYILGQVLKIEGILMVLPCVTAVIYQESQGLAYLAVGLNLTKIYKSKLEGTKVKVNSIAVSF